MEGHPTVESLLVHSGWVKGLADSLVSDPNRADDVVQETWIAAMERPPGRVQDARAWLAGVVRNLVREDHRSSRRRDVRERTSARSDLAPSTADVVARADLHQELARTVLELREPYRSTLLLRYFEGMTADQIAGELGVPSSTVRNRISRGLEQLRERLDNQHGGRRSAWLALLTPQVGAPAAALAPTTATGGMLMLKWTAIVLGTTAFGGALLFQHRAAGPDPLSHSTLGGSVALQEPEVKTQNPAQQDARKSVPPKPAPAISGRVVDEEQRPIPGAEVFIGGYSDPFDGKADVAVALETQRVLESEGNSIYRLPANKLQAEKVVIGKRFATDEQGRFRVELEPERKVFVNALGKLGVRALPESGRWLESPAADIALTADVIPLAEATFRLTDETTGNVVRDFKLAVEGRDDSVVSRTGRARMIWEIPSGEAQSIHVAVVEPTWARMRKDLVLVPGGREELELVVRSEGEQRGTVVDGTGQPVEGALVFWGSRERLLGRSPWVYDPSRIIGAVHTGADGGFVLPGTGAELTAFGPGHSPTTVASADAGTIALAAAARVSGVLFDRDHAPRADLGIELEGIGETETDAEGRFTFDNVPAGLHALRWPERFWLGFALEPGETLDLVGGLRIDRVHVQVESGGAPFTPKFGGLILGQDKVFGIHEFGANQGAFETARMRRGRYVLMSAKGFVGHMHVDGPEAVADMGDADLTIITRPGERIFLVPKDEAPSAPALLTFARRMEREVGTTGRLTYRPIPRGTYLLGIHGQETLKEVTIPGPGTEIVLD